MKRFFCDKCGKCCEKLPALVIDPGLDDGTGKCKFYDSQTNLMIIELGEQGSGLAASMGGSMLGKGIGFLIGNTILPGLGGGVGYFVGEFIGSMAGYMIGSQIYHTVIDFFGSTNACPKDIRILIDQMATDLEQARVQLDKILSDIRIAEEDKISNAMCSLYQGVANSNYEQIDNSLTSICDLFGRKLAFPDQNSFDTFPGV